MKRLSYFQSCSIYWKVHKHEIILNLFLHKSKPYMALVNFRKNFDVRTFPRRLSIRGTKLFMASYQFFFSFTLVLLDGFLDSLSKFRLIIVKICILIWYFWVISKNYCMGMLSIRGNDFIAHWAYEEIITSHTKSTPYEFSRILSQQ